MSHQAAHFRQLWNKARQELAEERRAHEALAAELRACLLQGHMEQQSAAAAQFAAGVLRAELLDVEAQLATEQSQRLAEVSELKPELAEVSMLESGADPRQECRMACYQLSTCPGKEAPCNEN